MLLDNPTVSITTGLVLGIGIGALLATALAFPRIGRALGKLTAVSMIGCGVGLGTWGLMSALNGEEFKVLQAGPIVFYSAAQALGWAAGTLAAGVTALVLSFVGGVKR